MFWELFRPRVSRLFFKQKVLSEHYTFSSRIKIYVKAKALKLGIKAMISAIDERLSLLDNQDADECECGLEAMGQIGSSTRGAILLLSDTSAARHVSAAFDLHGRGKQLAALHSLGNIVGETRPENNKLLNADAEENPRRLIYETASNTPKLIPSGLVLAILKLESEFRIAVPEVKLDILLGLFAVGGLFSKEFIPLKTGLVQILH